MVGYPRVVKLFYQNMRHEELDNGTDRYHILRDGFQASFTDREIGVALCIPFR